ncbi:MAG TPA: hypothetical protein PLA50_19070, partial [Bacteroidia bacterium]|nr:hypothetical protein [Bacteroidia bacterium]
RGKLRDGARPVHAEIRGNDREGFEFSVTLSACGDGHVLAVVRNASATRALRERDAWQSAAFAHAPLAMLHTDALGRVSDANEAASSLFGDDLLPLEGREFSELIETGVPAGHSVDFLSLEDDAGPHGSLVFLPRSAVADGPAPAAVAAAPPRELRQHSFRNQLQLVTSLFSLEPQGAAARDAFVKWQVRLRSMALACPYDDSPTLWVSPLLRDLANEICSLLGKGPGRREVIVTGDEGLSVDAQTAAPFSLLIGELMRLVLAARQPGPGPELYINVRAHASGGFQLSVRPGTHRTFVFGDRESEIENLVLLTEQIQGRLEATDSENPAKEWTLVVPQRRR